MTVDPRIMSERDVREIASKRGVVGGVIHLDGDDVLRILGHTAAVTEQRDEARAERNALTERGLALEQERDYWKRAYQLKEIVQDMLADCNAACDALMAQRDALAERDKADDAKGGA